MAAEDWREVDVIGTFQSIEAHLRSKGHDANLDASRDPLRLSCRGVVIARAANVGIAVTALDGYSLATVLAALADLELDRQVRSAIVDEVRAQLAAVGARIERERSSQDGLGHLDTSGCDLPCDLVHECGSGNCDLGACDVIGCDL